MMKRTLLWGMTLCLVIGLGSCKSKQSAYKAAYQQAKEKEIAIVDEAEETPVTNPVNTVTKKRTTTARFQKEALESVDGIVKTYSVVIGSFRNKANATRLKEKFQEKGYKCSIGLNTERQMYRVIIGTYDTKVDAADLRDSVKIKYGLNDAWLLEKK